MIARGSYLLIQLLLGLGQHLGIVKLQGPIDRILRPHQQSHAVSGAQHRLIVRIVRQADKVAAQFLGPSQQRLRVFVGVGAAGAIRRFGMDGDAAQKDRLAIQQDFGAARLDGAEADQFVDGVLTGT